MVTWLIMRVKRSHPAHHLENREHHNQVVVGKVLHLMFQLDLNMHRPPKPNNSYLFGREPPDGAEKVPLHVDDVK